MAAYYWPDDYESKKRAPAQAIDLIRRGQRVFVGSACAEPQRLVQELAAQANRFTDLEIVKLMSLETTPLSLIADETDSHSFNLRSFYLGAAQTRFLSRYSRFVTPINLSQIPRLFKSGQLPLAAALVQCTPPDDFGWMNLGLSVDITLAAVQSADLVIAQVNPKMPRIFGQGFIHVNQAHIIVEHEEELLTASPAPEREHLHEISRHMSRLVPNGATLQLSLGATAPVLLSAFEDKNDLGIHTLNFGDPIMRLTQSGNITNRRKTLDQGKSVASWAIGSKELYEFLDNNPGLELKPADYVNNPRVIMAQDGLVALNLVKAVDLTGQATLDATPYNFYSSGSGVMDFVRGSQLARGGRSVLVLASTSSDGRQSGIVPQLEEAVVVIPRGDANYVVTEYGQVNLLGKNLQERALSLISIAHPDFREELFQQARQLGLLGSERTLEDASLHSLYPRQLEEARLYGQTEVLIRPAKAADERQLQEHFYQLAPEDVAARFFHDKAGFLREDLAAMYLIDYKKNLTLLALSGEPGHEKILAVGSYIWDEAQNLAEVAFSVVSAWQGQGLASLLLKKLALAAQEQGIAGLVAYTTTRNQSMVQVFKKLPFALSSEFEDGLLRLECDFSRPVAIS